MIATCVINNSCVCARCTRRWSILMAYVGTASGIDYKGIAECPDTGHKYIGHDYMDHNYTGRDHMGHNFMGRDHIGIPRASTTRVSLSTHTPALPKRAAARRQACMPRSRTTLSVGGSRASRSLSTGSRPSLSRQVYSYGPV